MRVTGKGRGVRCQELALAAAIELQGGKGVGLLAAGTDGQDGATDAAGSWADGETVAREADALAALADNDAYGFLSPAGVLFLPGLTGTNVMDMGIGLVDR